MNDIQKLRDDLDLEFPGRYQLEVGAGSTVILTIVDNVFDGAKRSERLAKIEPLINGAGLRPGIIELYSEQEARDRGIAIDPFVPLPPASWEGAVGQIESGIRPQPRDLGSRRLRRMVFYSYKGGVGRTTSLVHAAFHLARAGQRVAVVDMDVEAPGLHIVLPRPDGKAIECGLIDYLWERQVRPFDPKTRDGLETCVVQTPDFSGCPIAYSVEDIESKAQIYVIPAGVPGAEYVRRLHTLSSEDVLSHPNDAWSLFEEEVSQQLDVDLLLIDARTGLGDWGGLSLLRLADEAFLVLYPSEQNVDGIRFVQDTVGRIAGITVHTILSPIPEGAIGRELVAKVVPRLGVEEAEEVIQILYNPSIASAESFPVESAMASYAKIANLIRDTQAQDRAEEVIQKSDALDIIESLQFPARDAGSIVAGDFNQYFQKTVDFERFLDDARWVVRGRKGTGKSTLFHLFVDHREIADRRAKGRLAKVLVLPGHGPGPTSRLRPTTDVFGDISKAIAEKQLDWLSFWRAYALIRVYTSTQSALAEKVLSSGEMRMLRDHLRQNFQGSGGGDWRSSHTKAILQLLDGPLNGSCRDALRDLNALLENAGEKLWLLYDDLDQDIKENSGWQADALGGLLRLAYDANNQGMHNIRFKVFLREDIWAQLVFTNKSHFGPDRTLLLEWRIVDFLRLAYRMASGGSVKFRALAQRELPLTDDEIDAASEDDLQKVLAPLWGLRKEKRKNQSTARWVFSRMTDAANNTYPRSLSILLGASREAELESRKSKIGTKIVTSSDRLLGPPAMLVGLKAASVERVNALKNESPRLVPFLEAVEKGRSLRSQFGRDELMQVWEQTSKSHQPDFGLFVDELKQSGLLVEKKGGAAYDFGIASLYIDGLELQRVQGEKK